jgi:CPA2 family monovalent cation:H+ antiporter-2
VLPPEATQVLVISAIVSITLNSFLFRGIEPLLQWLGGRKLSGHSMAPPEMLAAHRGDEPSTIVVGYGPVGRMVTRLLRENHIEVVVIELNYQTVQLLHSQRVRAVHGDAANSEILLQAGMQHARSLIFTASGTPPEAVIRMAKELNPDAIVLARSAYVAEAEQLRNAGAHIIVTAEAEVALAMTERVLVGLGATPEQLDRERSRVRRSLFPVVTGSKPVENI